MSNTDKNGNNSYIEMSKQRFLAKGKETQSDFQSLGLGYLYLFIGIMILLGIIGAFEIFHN